MPLALSLMALLPLAGPAALCAGQTPPSAQVITRTPDHTADKIKAALAGSHRSASDRARDIYRHPLETLTFFGLKEDMHVIELWPGGGWYTEVLAPVLKEKGKLTITSFDPNGPPDAASTKSAKDLVALLDKNKAIFGQVKLAIVGPPKSIDLGPPGSADLVLTFRNLHNWITASIADKVFHAAYVALKPGGMLGVVEHRAYPGQDVRTGYVEEAAAIKLIKAAGFELVAKSEINANPKDTKDYPKGVWTLPPTLRLGEQNKEKYLAIGESDRMTLRFVKR